MQAAEVDKAVLIGQVLDGEIETLIHVPEVEQSVDRALIAVFAVVIDFGLARTQSESSEEMGNLLALCLQCHGGSRRIIGGGVQ